MSFAVVGSAFPRTIYQRTEFAAFDFLEDFSTTAVTGVCLYFNRGFHVRDTRYNPAYGDEVTEFCAFDVSHSKTGRLFLVRGRSQRFKVEVTGLVIEEWGILATGEGWRE